MHDPMTVAFEIRYPWWKYKPGTQGWDNGYRESFITIWHVDPERDGSDDSCGYTVPKLNKEQKRRLDVLAWDESRYPYFLRQQGREWTGTRAEAESLYRGLLLAVAHYMDLSMTFEQAAQEAARAIHQPNCVDNARHFCFEPGYDTNFKQDDPDYRQEHMRDIVYGIARWQLKDRRPWWRHPKWHVWHWSIQVHPVQQFKRWAFSRCAQCGKRFTYGYSPVSHSWHSDGPRWFRSEVGVYHSECSNVRVMKQAASA